MSRNDFVYAVRAITHANKPKAPIDAKQRRQPRVPPRAPRAPPSAPSPPAGLIGIGRGGGTPYGGRPVGIGRTPYGRVAGRGRRAVYDILI